MDNIKLQYVNIWNNTNPLNEENQHPIFFKFTRPNIGEGESNIFCHLPQKSPIISLVVEYHCFGRLVSVSEFVIIFQFL